jgi:hypothetical protein
MPRIGTVVCLLASVVCLLAPIAIIHNDNDDERNYNEGISNKDVFGKKVRVHLDNVG